MVEESAEVAGGHRPQCVVRAFEKSSPITFQQEWALNHWMLDEREPYVVPLLLRLKGPLNADALHGAVRSIVQRHDALRTRIVSADGVTKQEVDCSEERPLSVVELHTGSPEDRENEANILLGKIILEPRDLANGPLSSFTLIRLSECEHVLACVVHHLLFDGMSVKILGNELSRTYGEFIRGLDSLEKKVPLRYSEYATWQRDQDADWRREHQNYWQVRLAEAEAVRLPRDRGLGSFERFSGAVVRVSLGVPLSERLYALARHVQSTITLLMFALYAIALSVWSGQTDFVVPLCVSARHRRMEMGMIGQVAEYLPLRIAFQPDSTVMDILKRMSRELSDCSKHLDCGRIVNESPQFFGATSFHWLENFWAVSGPSGASYEEFPNAEQFPLKFLGANPALKMRCDTLTEFYDFGEGIGGFMQYRSEYFAPTTVEAFFERMKRIAVCVAKDPWARIWEMCKGHAP